MVALHEPRPVLEPPSAARLGEEVLALFVKGNELFDNGDYERALQAYDDALRVAPNDPVVLTNRGAALAALGRLAEALSAYDQALTVDPDDHTAHHNRGVALAQLRRFEAAVEEYNRALEKGPRDAGTLANRALALAHLGRVSEAVSSIDAAIAAGEEANLRKCRSQIVGIQVAALSDKGLVNWSGSKPSGTHEPVSATKGPPVSDYVTEDRA